MKVRIMGGNCSGKTTFASKLSKQTKLPVFSLDDIQFIEKFLKMREQKDRIKLLHKITTKKNWIIEGTQRSEWTKDSVKKANIIIILKDHKIKQYYRVTLRWIKRIITKTHKESLKGLFELYRMIHNYDNPKHVNFNKRQELLKNNKAKIIIIRNNKEQAKLVDYLKKTCKSL